MRPLLALCIFICSCSSQDEKMEVLVLEYLYTRASHFESVVSTAKHIDEPEALVRLAVDRLDALLEVYSNPGSIDNANHLCTITDRGIERLRRGILDNPIIQTVIGLLAVAGFTSLCVRLKDVYNRIRNNASQRGPKGQPKQ